MRANNPRSTAIIYAVLAGSSFGVFLVGLVYTAVAGDGVGFGAVLFFLIGTVFAAVAGHYWTMPPTPPKDHARR